MADLKRWGQDKISRMRRDVDRLFDDLCMDLNLPAMFCRVSNDLELGEEGDSLVAKLNLGETHPDDVDVSVMERTLVISARSETRASQHSRVHAFRKEIRLPCVVQQKDVEAEVSDGILVVRLPKCPNQHGQSITIIKK